MPSPRISTLRRPRTAQTGAGCTHSRCRFPIAKAVFSSYSVRNSADVQLRSSWPRSARTQPLARSPRVSDPFLRPVRFSRILRLTWPSTWNPLVCGRQFTTTSSLSRNPAPSSARWPQSASRGCCGPKTVLGHCARTAGGMSVFSWLVFLRTGVSWSRPAASARFGLVPSVPETFYPVLVAGQRSGRRKPVGAPHRPEHTASGISTTSQPPAAFQNVA